MTVLLTSTFTGSNGAPWPSPWSTALVGGTTGGGVDIQTNRGRMRARDGDYTVARADATGITVDDILITGTVRFPVRDEQYVHFWVRGGGWDAGSASNKSNGYYFLLGMGYWTNDELTLGKKVNGVNTSLDFHFMSNPNTYQVNVDYNFKFDLNANNIQGKIWNPLAEAEPAWQVSAVDNSFSSGGVALSLMSGSAIRAREANFDNFTVTSTTELVVQPSNWTSYIERTTAVNPSTPMKQFFRYDAGTSSVIPVDMYVGGP